MYGIIHESDCARHNMPSMPKADCNCYLSKLTGAEFDAVKAMVAKWDYATEAAIEAYLLGRDTERFFKCGDQNDDGKREPRKLPPPSIQCACAFTEWYGMPIDADMDIQTQVAWENWQIAWNASLDAAASEQVEPASVNEELEATKRMFHAACADLGAINEALGLDPDDGGAEPILDAIEELKAAAQPAQAQAVQEKQERPCTCHPGDNPPIPCARKYVLSECKAILTGIWINATLEDPANESVLYVVTDSVGNYEIATWHGSGVGGGWTHELRDVDREDISAWLMLPIYKPFCPRPINTAQEDTEEWCIKNGNCGCGRGGQK